VPTLRRLLPLGEPRSGCETMLRAPGSGPDAIGAAPRRRAEPLHSGPVPLLRHRSHWLVAIVVLFYSPSVVGDEVHERSADSEAGVRAWQRCSVCHGADGAGNPDGTFPKIAGQYAPVIEAQLAAIRSSERSNPVMKPHVEELSDARDVADVAAFVAAMPRDATCQPGPGDDLERGARLYRTACARCHGEAGQGDAAERVPWLACQHYAYLLRRARQLAAWGRNAHPGTDPPLSTLTDADLRAVTDHAARLPAPAPTPQTPNTPD